MVNISSCKVHQVDCYFHNIIKVGLLPCNRSSCPMIQNMFDHMFLNTRRTTRITFPFIGIGATNISNSGLGELYFLTSLTPYESFFSGERE